MLASAEITVVCCGGPGGISQGLAVGSVQFVFILFSAKYCFDAWKAWPCLNCADSLHSALSHRGEEVWAQAVRKVEKEDGEISDWQWANYYSEELPRHCGPCAQDSDPQSVSPIFSPRRSVAFFQFVLLDLTDGIWSELPLYYIMEILPGLACVPLLRRKTQLCWGCWSNCSELFLEVSGWRCDLSPMGVCSHVAVISTFCISVRLGESPKIGIWVFGSVCCLSTYSSFPYRDTVLLGIFWCV